MRAAAFSLPAAAAAAGPTVTLPGGGTLAGVSAHGGSSFLGVPYAAPPVGELRWMPPAPAPTWKGTRDAKKFGAACVGAAQLDGSCGNTTSEDCLFLNVYAPATIDPSAKLPVMIWVHGGGYTTGCSDVFAGPAIVRSSKQSVIVITTNYRLNVFGFLASSQLATPDGGTGNYGIQDQRAAMQWAHDNIAAFGGDPGNVLIFGESAGGDSMWQHLVQKASWPLYHKVVVESGGKGGGRTLASAEKTYASLARQLGCKDAACMRSLPAAKVEAAGVSGGPTIDGVSLTGVASRIIDAGGHNTKVPVIVGSNRDERAFWFVLERKENMTEAQFDASVASTGKGAEIKKLYDASVYPYPADLGPYNHWWWASMRVQSDPGLGHCSVRHNARALAAANPAVWTYLHAHPLQQAIPAVPGTGPGSAVVPHASEIMFVFDCGTADDPQCATADEQQLGDAMSQYWVRFAQSGDPNGGGAPRWDRFTAAADNNIRFETESEAGIKMQTGLRQAACDFWGTQKSPATADF